MTRRSISSAIFPMNILEFTVRRSGSLKTQNLVSLFGQNHAAKKVTAPSSLRVVTAQQGMVLFNPLVWFAHEHRQSVLQDANLIANLFDDIRTM